MRTRAAMTGALAVTVAAAFSATACAAQLSSAPVTGAGSEATVPALAAVPDTAGAARAAAVGFFALYSAGQWQAAWQRLAAADQRLAPESVYVGFHDACPSQAAGLAYKVVGVTMAGEAAVVTYTIPVVASLGSATVAEQWAPGGWRTSFTSGLGRYYGHGSVKADVAAAKAGGECAGS